MKLTTDQRLAIKDLIERGHVDVAISRCEEWLTGNLESYVTRESAERALSKLALYNGSGAEAEARGLLMPI